MEPKASNLRARLQATGQTLPSPPTPAGAYDAVRVLGGLACVAIQFPVRDGVWEWQGRLGRELTTQQGYEAARLCALNVLAQIEAAVGSERIEGLVRIEAYLQAVDGWDEFPLVVNGASELFLQALGERGRHSRSLCGVERLPRNVPVAIVATFAVR